MQNYDLLVERITRASGLEQVDVEAKIEAKKAKLSGLISKEGAAQIVAAELGISFENQDLKINEVTPGLRKVNVVGKIINLFPIREFSKNGREGKVANFILADDTGSIRIVLWDMKHIEMIESDKIKQGDVVEIKNGSSRESEIHLSGFSELKKSETEMEDVKTTRPVDDVNLIDARQGQNIKTRGLVVQIFQPRFYNVCPTCNKKVVSENDVFKCAEHGIVEPNERAILNFVIDDGTESMRVVMFSDQIKQLVEEGKLKDEAEFSKFREDFLGSEIFLSGRVNRNQLFNNLEVVAGDVERVDVEKLIESLSE
jgi:ssDNA-binding replication factor A large subunit